MSDPGPLRPPADHRRPVGCALIAAIVFGLFLLLVLGAVLAWKSAQNRRVASALAAIRQRGEPTDALELQAWNLPPAGAADLGAQWTAAISQLESASGAQQLPFLGTADDPPPPGQPWAELAAAEQLLADHADALQQLRQAAAQGGRVRFEQGFGQDLQTTMEHVQLVRNAARMLQLEAHVQAHRGNARGVADSIETMQRLAETLAEESVLISQLVRIAVCGITVDLYGTMLSRVEFSEEDLARLAAGFQTMRLSDGLECALIGERVMGIAAFRNAESLADAGVTVPPLPALNRQADLAVYLELMGEAIATSRLPPAQLRQNIPTWRQLVAQTSGQSGRVRYPVTAQLLPAFEAAAEAFVRGDVYNQAVVTASMIEIYRRRHGRLPERLEDLVPELLAEVPLDPFTGQTLRYVVQEDGYRVYSVGPDGQDHGGQPPGDDIPYGQTDLVITVR